MIYSLTLAVVLSAAPADTPTPTPTAAPSATPAAATTATPSAATTATPSTATSATPAAATTSTPSAAATATPTAPTSPTPTGAPSASPSLTPAPSPFAAPTAPLAPTPPIARLWTKEPASVFGVPFGATEPELEKLVKSNSCTGGGENAKVSRVCTSPLSLGDLKIDAYFGFSDDGKIGTVWFNFDSARYALIEQLFVGMYGPPTGGKEFPIEDPMHRELTQREAIWTGVRTDLQLQRHAGKMTEGVARFTTMEYRAGLAAKAKAEKPEAATGP